MLSSYQTEPVRRERGSKPLDVIVNAQLCDAPAFALYASRQRGLKGKGLRYEARVFERIAKALPDDWVLFDKQWLQFHTDAGLSGICQPDAFILNPLIGRIIIVEVKLSRTSKAWYQLRRYETVLRVIFPLYEFARVEIASTVYAVDVPEKVRTIWNILDARVGATSFMKMSYNAR